MRKYDSYKDSKTDAFGDIPVDWKVIRMKHLVDSSKYYQIGDGDHGSIKPEMYLFDSGIPYIRVQNLTWNGKLDFNGMVYISDEVQEKNLKSKLIPNDILIAKTGATIGKLAIIPDEIEQANTTSSVGKITVNQSRFNSKYVLFAMMSRQFTDQIWIEASQKSAQPGFNVDDLVLFQIAIPKTLEEQIAIADYLDRKTAEIDELIADKKRLLELYEEEKAAIINQAVTKGINPDVPMKDSGIEWLGEIPEHWEVKRIRHVAQIFGRIGYRGYKTTDLVPKGEGAITISPSNMKAYHMEYENCTYLSWEKYEESPEIMIYNDDILFVKTGSTYGKVSFVENLPEKATINPQIIVLKQITCINKYLWYVLKSSNIIYQVERTVVGGTIPTISQAKINNYEFPIPSDEEQTEIVNFIDNETNRVEKLINKTEKLIDLLTEYRTALISEVVTGKIKVTL